MAKISFKEYLGKLFRDKNLIIQNTEDIEKFGLIHIISKEGTELDRFENKLSEDFLNLGEDGKLIYYMHKCDSVKGVWLHLYKKLLENYNTL